MNQTIELMVNRHMLKIPTKSILYATVTDKLCKIYLDNQETLNLFVTISELMEKLGEECFLRVSRSALVSFAAIEAVSKDEIVLSNGIRVPYSRTRRGEIAEKIKYHTETIESCGDLTHKVEPLDFAHEFSFWDKVPIAFGVLEFLQNDAGKITDFICRYVNQALAAIEEVPRERLLTHPFGELFPEDREKWIAHYCKVAFQGEVLELMEYVPGLNKDLLMICYQPAYGYCACIVVDASNKYYLQIKQYLVD